MKRALELANNGAGRVSPNPMVGCVVVHNGRIIGEGYHQQYGGPHAEVNAIASVKDTSLLPESTVYVTLEPCSHFGKTPPCANLLVEKKVKRVVAALTDPNPLVAGKGMAIIAQAGIETQVGLLEEEAREANKRFLTYMEKKRPYIILKWAETADGFVAREDFSSKWISNGLSRKLVHKLRAEEDAILVGTRTALHDNPRLNARDWPGKDPLRCVIDKQLALPHSHHLFSDNQPTVCYNLLKDEQVGNVSFVKVAQEAFLSSMATDLYQRKQQSLIVEGGTSLLNSFIKAGLWDEAWVFKASHSFGKGVAAPVIKGKLAHTEPIISDRLLIYHQK